MCPSSMSKAPALTSFSEVPWKAMAAGGDISMIGQLLGRNGLIDGLRPK